MSFVAPLWLAVAGVVASGVVLAHLFRRTVPPQDLLPTVRFVPEGAPVAVLRSRRLSDIVLLLMRLAVVALLGLALAGAHVARDAPRSVVIIDASRAVQSMPPVEAGAEYIVFDSIARRATSDELESLRPTQARGSLSAALVLANRLVAGTEDGGAGTELIMMSPIVREEIDSAVTPLLGLWPGPIRSIRPPPAPLPSALTWEIRASGDDPVAAALSTTPNGRGAATVRIVRAAATRADSQWAMAGGALVVWPAVSTASAVADTSGAIATVRHVAVASFARHTRLTGGESLVRWADGEPAAMERALGRGCIRDVAIPVDGVGDFALRESFRGIARSLLEPCGGARDFAPADVSSHESRVTSHDVVSAGSWPLWFALAAAALLIAEQFMRRERATA